MSEIYPYRANEELAEALRDFEVQRRQHIAQVVKPFVAEHPNNEPLVDNRERVLGFADKDRTNPPPAGLSRSQRRAYLIPVKGKPGAVWREWMDKLNLPTTEGDVLHEFGFREQLYAGSDGRHYMGRPSAVDFGDDGVFVYMGCEISPLPDCVEPVKLSEFYAAQERAQERAKAGEVA